MRYKKGDRVRIKSLEWYYANKNSEGAIIFHDFRIFDESMSEFCGKVVTIDDYIPRGNYYDIKEDGKVNLWSGQLHPPKEGCLSKGFHPLTWHIDKCSY